MESAPPADIEPNEGDFEDLGEGGYKIDGEEVITDDHDHTLIKMQGHL